MITDTTYETDVVDGVYTWTVAAYDGLGNTSHFTDVWSLEVDATAPDAPSLLSPVDGTLTSTKRLILAWATSAGLDVAGYLLDWNGALKDVGNTTEFHSALLADGVYTWTVAAYDGLDLLQEIRQQFQDLPVIISSASKTS